MATVTDQTRAAVWRTLCDLEWNCRYYDALADKYRFRYLALRFGILGSVPVEGAILYFATGYPWLFILAVLVGVLLAILTLWDAISNYAEQAAIIRLTAFACDDLKRETEALWRRVETDAVAADEADASHESIVARSGQRSSAYRPARTTGSTSEPTKKRTRTSVTGMPSNERLERRTPGPQRPTHPPPPPPPPRPERSSRPQPPH